MSPIIARAAVRAAGRRQFSLASSVRSFARSMEPHPFERLPVTQKAARGDYAKLAKNIGQRAVFFAPAITVLLGWPFLAKQLMDGHI